jgi:hypothetical protein
MKKENGSPDVHIIYHSPRWHVYWNLFKHGYRSWEVNFRKSQVVGDYAVWVSFGIGQFSMSFRPTKRAVGRFRGVRKMWLW